MTCPTGKIEHPTREAALEHQKAVVYRNHVEGDGHRSAGLTVYVCGDCHTWHVGHLTGAPNICHYTTVHALDAILAADALCPARARPSSLAVDGGS